MEWTDPAVHNHDKAICIEKIVTKAASCAPVRRWVASGTKQASALDVALFHQVKIRSIGVRFGKKNAVSVNTVVSVAL